MKRVLLIAALCGISVTAAAEVGLGVSIRSNDSTIYVPIEIGDSFRIEPLLRYARSKSESTTSGFRLESDSRTYSIGTGLFALTSLGESITLYYGGRLSYMSQRASGTSLEMGPFGPSYLTIRSEADGFSVAPTVGLEYHLAKFFSIAGEAALTHTDIDGDDNLESKTTSTTSNIVFRYRF
jgi:hypothetical protein